MVDLNASIFFNFLKFFFPFLYFNLFNFKYFYFFNKTVGAGFEDKISSSSSPTTGPVNPLFLSEPRLPIEPRLLGLMLAALPGPVAAMDFEYLRLAKFHRSAAKDATTIKPTCGCEFRCCKSFSPL